MRFLSVGCEDAADLLRRQVEDLTPALGVAPVDLALALELVETPLCSEDRGLVDAIGDQPMQRQAAQLCSPVTFRVTVLRAREFAAQSRAQRLGTLAASSQDLAERPRVLLVADRAHLFDKGEQRGERHFVA